MCSDDSILQQKKYSAYELNELKKSYRYWNIQLQNL